MRRRRGFLIRGERRGAKFFCRCIDQTLVASAATLMRTFPDPKGRKNAGENHARRWATKGCAMSAQPDRVGAAFASLYPSAPKRLGICTIWRVAQHDLFGTKDVQDSPTLSYIWLADQFGHIGIGFMGTLAVMQLLGLVAEWPLLFRAAIAAGAATLFILLKEWRDFRVESRQSQPGKTPRPEPFVFNAGEVFHNCVCACFFVISGALIALAGVYRIWAGVAAFVVLGAIAAVVAYWWLQRKVAFQQADLPFLYRLAKFPRNFADAQAEDVLHALICGTPSHRHVMIGGPLDSGKTSLAVRIGTEAAFRLQIARFTTLVKLSQTGASLISGKPIAGPRPDTTFDDGRVLWPLDDVDLLIVDDLDGGLVGPAPIEPEKIRAALLEAPGPGFFAKYAARRTVWIAGVEDRVSAWRQVIADLVADGNADQVGVVLLREEYDKALAGS
jgi:hypothetical protein